ncbi:hypothetical protein FAIPA1_20237 [Frankia sp. AiPs1]
MLYYQQRMRFLLGRFEYTETGLMDATHLRFFTRAGVADSWNVATGDPSSAGRRQDHEVHRAARGSSASGSPSGGIEPRPSSRPW